MELLKKNEDLFAPTDAEIGRTEILEFTIDTGDHQPIRQRPYPADDEKRQTIEEHLESMLEAGVIEKSNSPWASPVLLVPKPKELKITGKPALRFCVDYRKLNDVTTKNTYPLPNITDLIDSLEGAKIFSSLDLKSGYWQIPLRESDKEKTAFVTHKGLYQFNRVPFGLANAPSVFANLISIALNGLQSICLAYLDDIIVFSKTEEEHIANLRTVFERLQAAGLKLKPSKCEYMSTTLDFLGHIISAEGLRVDPYKVKAISGLEPPTKIRGVRAFLGMCSYYRKFIKNMATIAKPLTDLTKKDTPFEWTTECQRAFDTLKAALQNTPTLAYPKEADDHPYVLYTKGGKTTLTATLAQRDPTGKERDIHYFSSVLNPTEQNYPEHERECYAIVKALSKFNRYLADNRFMLYSPIHPFTALANAQPKQRRLMRWLNFLKSHRFDHREFQEKNEGPSTDITPNVTCMWPEDDEDYVSPLTGVGERICPLCQQPEEEEGYDENTWRQDVFDHMRTTKYETHPQLCMDCTRLWGYTLDDDVCTPLDRSTTTTTTTQRHTFTQQDDSGAVPEIRNLINVANEDWKQPDAIETKDPEEDEAYKPPDKRTIRRAQRRDPDTLATIQLLTNGSTVKDYAIEEDGLLYHYATPIKMDPEPRKQLVIPKALTKEILTIYHNPYHWGTEKNYAVLHARFYWKTMYQDCAEHVKNCTNCTHVRLQKSKAPLKNERPLPAHPFAEVMMDLIGPLPKTEFGEFQYIATFVDVFSGWPEAYPLRNKSAESVARVIANELIPRHSTIPILRSDNGREFCNELVDSLSSDLGIQRITCLPYAPQSNGMIERFNQTLIRGIKKRIAPYVDEYANWHLHIPSVLFAHRVAPHERTRQSPFSVLYGREPYLMADKLFTPKTACDGDQFQKKQLWKMHNAFNLVRTMTAQAREEQRKQYNKKLKEVKLEEGMNVWYYNPRNIQGPSKLHSHWRPMYKIIEMKPKEAVLIRHQPSGKDYTVHRNQLQPVNPANAWDMGDDRLPNQPVGVQKPFQYKRKDRPVPPPGASTDDDSQAEDDDGTLHQNPDGLVPNARDHDARDEESHYIDPRATIDVKVPRPADRDQDTQEEETHYMETRDDAANEATRGRKRKEATTKTKTKHSCAEPKDKKRKKRDDSDEDYEPTHYYRSLVMPARSTTAGLSTKTGQEPTPSTSGTRSSQTQSQDSGHPTDYTPPDDSEDRSDTEEPMDTQQTMPEDETPDTDATSPASPKTTQPPPPDVERYSPDIERYSPDETDTDDDDDTPPPPTINNEERTTPHTESRSTTTKTPDTPTDNPYYGTGARPKESPPRHPRRKQTELDGSTQEKRSETTTKPHLVDIATTDDDDTSSRPTTPRSDKTDETTETRTTRQMRKDDAHVQTDPSPTDADDEAESEDESQEGIVLGNTYNRPIIPHKLRAPPTDSLRSGPAANTRSHNLYQQTLRNGDRGLKRQRSESKERASENKVRLLVDSDDEEEYNYPFKDPFLPPPVVEGSKRNDRGKEPEIKTTTITIPQRMKRRMHNKRPGRMLEPIFENTWNPL